MKDFFTFDEAMRDLAIILGVFLLIYVSRNITPLTLGTVLSGDAEGGLLSFFVGKVNVVSLRQLIISSGDWLGVLAVVLLGGVFWISLRIRDIKKAEREKFAPVHAEENEAKALLVRWQVVLNHVNSESPAEWKLAILEADNILDEILDAEGYEGETIGEKLKAMDPGVIHSYNDLWEAHKMRNQIAHETTTVELSKKSARDTINKFEVAFKELGHI